MGDQTTSQDIRRFTNDARIIVNACVDKLYEAARISPLCDDDSDRMVEQSILALLLVGLKDGAERRGIGWQNIEEDARIARDAADALPASNLVQ